MVSTTTLLFRGCLQFGEAYPCPSCICSRSGPRYTSPRKSASLKPEDEHISLALPSAAPRKAGINSLAPQQSSVASRIPACPSVTLLPLVSGVNGGVRRMGVWSRSPPLLELLGLRHSKLHSQGVRKLWEQDSCPHQSLPMGRAPGWICSLSRSFTPSSSASTRSFAWNQLPSSESSIRASAVSPALPPVQLFSSCRADLVRDGCLCSLASGQE